MATAIASDYPVAHFHLGVSKLKSRLVHEAIEDFNRAIALKEDPFVYDGLGCCYH